MEPQIFKTTFTQRFGRTLDLYAQLLGVPLGAHAKIGDFVSRTDRNQPLQLAVRHFCDLHGNKAPEKDIAQHETDLADAADHILRALPGAGCEMNGVNHDQVKNQLLHLAGKKLDAGEILDDMVRHAKQVVVGGDSVAARLSGVQQEGVAEAIEKMAQTLLMMRDHDGLEPILSNDKNALAIGMSKAHRDYAACSVLVEHIQKAMDHALDSHVGRAGQLTR